MNEKSFNVSSVIKDRGKLPGALVKTNWSIEYTLEIECDEGKIMLSFKEFGPLEASNKNFYQAYYPSSGSNSMGKQFAGVQYIFNSKGEIAKGCAKLKTIFEDYANNIAKNIESNLK